MKVGDIVMTKTDKNFLDDGSLGVIVDTRKVAATRREDRGKDTHVHQVCWSAPSYDVVWIMERDLTQVIN